MLSVSPSSVSVARESNRPQLLLLKACVKIFRAKNRGREYRNGAQILSEYTILYIGILGVRKCSTNGQDTATTGSIRTTQPQQLASTGNIRIHIIELP